MPDTVDPYKEIEEFKGKRYKLSSALNFGVSILQANVPEDRDPYLRYSEKLKGKWVSLNNALSESRHAQSVKEKKRRREELLKRKQAGIVGRNEAKRKGLWRPHQSAARYRLFLPIHHLWLGYIEELLQLPPPPDTPSNSPSLNFQSTSTMQARLVKADFHGAIITVKQSKNSSLVGLSGIIVHETENTLRIVTKGDEFKGMHTSAIYSLTRLADIPYRIPSDVDPNAAQEAAPSTSTLALEGHTSDSSPLDLMPAWELELYGNQFCFRSADRATRKFKHKETIELL